MDRGDEPVTKQEFREGLRELGQEFRQDLAELRQGLRDELLQEFHQRMDEFAASLKETMHAHQTELLRCMAAQQQSNFQRFVALETGQTTTSTLISTLTARLAVFEERLLRVEQKLYLPPAA